MPPEDKLYNAVWNNPDGYGLVIKGSKRFDIIRKLPKNLENDPKEIMELLHKNKKFHRFLHVRNATKGGVTEENVHPFVVYEDDDRTVLFMHNGTLHTNFGEYPNTWCDSKGFAVNVLEEIFSKSILNNGPGDYTDPYFQKLLDKNWTGYQNRGILISNNLNSLRFGNDWKTYDVGGKKWYASNDTYFNEVKRGPEFQRRKKKEEEEIAKRRAEEKSRTSAFNRNATSNNEIVDWHSVGVSRDVFCKEALEKFNTDPGIWDYKLLCKFALTTHEEVVDFIGDDLFDTAQNVNQDLYDKILQSDTYLMIYVLSLALSDCYDQLLDKTQQVLTLEEKQNRATKLIATLKGKNEPNMEQSVVEQRAAE